MPHGIVLPSSDSVGTVVPLSPETVQRAVQFTARNVSADELPTMLEMLGITEESTTEGMFHFSERVA